MKCAGAPRRASTLGRVRRLLVLLVLAAAALAGAVPAAASAARREVPPRFLGMVGDGPLMEEPVLREAGSTFERELDLMVGSGVESMRFSVYWSAAQPYPSWDEVPAGERARFRDVGGVPTDFSRPDRVVLEAARRDVELLPVILGAPNWAARHIYRLASPPSDAQAYAAFTAALVRRYGLGGDFWRERRELKPVPITMWQIWNEMSLRSFWIDQPFEADYVALLRAVKPAVRAADPRAKVVIGGLVNRSWEQLDRLYRAGARGLFDLLALHPFTAEPKGVLTIIRRARRVMKRNGDARVPLLVTELSWPSSKGRTSVRESWEMTERGQAARVEQALPLMAARRRELLIRRVYWYSWMTRDIDSEYSFDYAGLRRSTRQVIHTKPAFHAFRRTALRLEGCRRKAAVATRCR